MGRCGVLCYGMQYYIMSWCASLYCAAPHHAMVYCAIIHHVVLPHSTALSLHHSALHPSIPSPLHPFPPLSLHPSTPPSSQIGIFPEVFLGHTLRAISYGFYGLDKGENCKNSFSSNLHISVIPCYEEFLHLVGYICSVLKSSFLLDYLHYYL
jgi:hypothetical protein